MRTPNPNTRRTVNAVLSALLALQTALGALVPQAAQAIVANGMPAIDVIGQYDTNVADRLAPVFTRGGGNNGPNNFGMDGSGTSMIVDTIHHRLIAADQNNRRVLIYNLKTDNTLDDRLPDYVLGQADFFSISPVGSQSVLGYTTALAYDATNDRLFVADSSSNRVLVFSLAGGITSGMNASHVLGQADFVSGTNAVTQSRMYSPRGLYYEASNQRLFVADILNRRVLVFNLSSGIINGMNASYVLGQTDFTSRVSATTQSGMSTPSGLVYDNGNQRLFVIDGNRVLVFDLSSGLSNGMNASYVLGQPNFTSSAGAVTQSGMTAPLGLVLDSLGQRLFVADWFNNRVLVFNLSSGLSNGMAASNVLGQTLFTSSTSATTQSGMFGPYGLGYDAGMGRLYVQEGRNNRILVFDVSAISDGQNAIDVVGQFQNTAWPPVPSSPIYTQGGPNSGPSSWGVSAGATDGLAFDAVHHRLFIPETGNSRVLIFDLNSDNTLRDKIADNVLGQPGFFSSAAATTQSGMNYPNDAAYDADNNRLFVSESINNRVLVFDLSSGLSNGMNASYVLGQPNFTSSAAATTQAGMSSPYGVDYDAASRRLFVGEYTNKRILVFDLSSGLSNGMNASYVLGQPNFTSSAAATTQAGMSRPYSVDYDLAGQRLFVADGFNNRFLGFNLSGGISNGMNASFVLGQTGFTSSAAATSQTGVIFGRGVDYDAANQRLYTTEGSNSGRIMIWDVSTATGTTSSTLSNRVTVSRLAAGASSTFSLSFTLTHNLSSVLTVTFPAGFTVTSAAATADSSSCLSNFTHDSLHLYAQKTNCAGPITLGGATITNPSTPGTYKIFYVNDDPGFISISVTADDQITVSGNVDPSLSFNVGTQAAATACAGSFVGNGGTLAFGVLTSGAVTTSDSSVDHVCTRISTNATGGATVTVKSLNAGLKSTSASADVISSATGTLVPGTPGYGLCVGSGVGDTGKDATVPVGASPSAAAPFASACSTSAHNVGGLMASAQNLWTLSTSSQNAFARLFLKAAISGTTPAHNDYTDTLTFVASGTY